MPELDLYLTRKIYEIEDEVNKRGEDRESIVRRAIDL